MKSRILVGYCFFIHNIYDTSKLGFCLSFFIYKENKFIFFIYFFHISETYLNFFTIFPVCSFSLYKYFLFLQKVKRATPKNLEVTQFYSYSCESRGSKFIRMMLQILRQYVHSCHLYHIRRLLRN